MRTTEDEIDELVDWQLSQRPIDGHICTHHFAGCIWNAPACPECYPSN